MKNHIFITILVCIFFVISSNPVFSQSSVLENQKAASQKSDDDRSIQDWISAFYHYLNQGNFDQAINEAERWEKRSEGLDDQNSRALYLKATALHILKRHKETIPVLDKIASIYLNSKSEEALFIARKSMIDKASILILIGNLEEAMNTYISLYPQISESNETKYQEMTAKTLFGQGFVRTRQGNNSEAIYFYASVIVKFKDKNIPQTYATLSDTFLNLGARHAEIGDTNLAIRTWSTGINDLKNIKDAKIMFNVSQMIMNIGSAREKNNETEKAINTYKELVRAFEGISTPEIKFNVEEAKRRLLKLAP